MKTLSETDVTKAEAELGISLPRFYRKFLIEEGYGETTSDKEIYHPLEILELYENKFDDEELLFKKYFPIGCNNKSQELWIIDINKDKISSISHETHEDDWPNEIWCEYSQWVSINIEQ